MIRLARDDHGDAVRAAKPDRMVAADLAISTVRFRSGHRRPARRRFLKRRGHRYGYRCSHHDQLDVERQQLQPVGIDAAQISSHKRFRYEFSFGVRDFYRDQELIRKAGKDF